MGWEADAVQRQYDMARTSIPGARSGGMDPTIGASLVSGGFGVAQSVAGGKAAKEAAKAQERASDKALAFAREQEATRQAQYGQAFKMWHASQNALRERYGLPPLPPMEAFPAAGGAEQAQDPRRQAAINFATKFLGATPEQAEARLGSRFAAPAPAAAGRPVTAAEGGPMPGATIGQMIAPRDAEADLGRWNDWQRYELG